MVYLLNFFQVIIWSLSITIFFYALVCFRKSFKKISLPHPSSSRTSPKKSNGPVIWRNVTGNMAPTTQDLGVTSDSKKRKASFVQSLILFEAKENPSWRKSKATVNTMLSDIVRFQKRWDQTKNDFETRMVSDVLKSFLNRFIFHVNYEEDHGYRTLEETEHCLNKAEDNIHHRGAVSTEERETINLRIAYEYFADISREADKEISSELHGLVECSILRESHKRILEGVELPNGNTKPGKFSDKPRITEFKGELYEYQNPQDMEKAVATVLDHHNSLLDSVKSEPNEITRVYDLFKTCAVLLFELLDLHPFSDGNGRLCRLLCSYCLSVFTPFPTPIYNVWSDSSKDDYKQALVDARKSAKRHPESLTTMIIECNWYGWKEFFKALEGKTEQKVVDE